MQSKYKVQGNAKKKPRKGGSFYLKRLKTILFFAVFLLELLHTPGSIHQHLLAREIRVRSRAYLHFDHWIFFAISEFDFFIGHVSGTAQKLEIAGSIPKNNFLIIRMDALFHSYFPKRTA